MNEFVKFGDCVDLVRENINPKEIPNVPYIGLEHIEENTLHLNGFGFSSDIDSTKLRFKKGDILFGKLRPYFRKVIIAPFDGICSTDIWVIRAKEGFDQQYIFYWMAGEDFVKFSMAGSEGTKMPRAKWEHVVEFERPYFDLSHQQRIGEILSTFDDKIELNRQMNQTLESMARAIFKSWFVDFDPVYAKMEGRDYPLPPEIMYLFPDELEESELGLIPKGWKVGNLEQLVGQRSERINASKETEFLPYVPIDLIKTKSLFLEESKSGLEAKSSLIKFYQGDLLFGAMRPYFHKVCIAPFNGITRTTAFVLYPKESIDFSYITLLIHHPSTIKYSTAHSTGSTIPYVKWKNSLGKMRIIIPPNIIRKEFNETVKPILDNIPNKYFFNSNLREIRDHLLPRLLA